MYDAGIVMEYNIDEERHAEDGSDPCTLADMIPDTSTIDPLEDLLHQEFIEAVDLDVQELPKKRQGWLGAYLRGERTSRIQQRPSKNHHRTFFVRVERVVNDPRYFRRSRDLVCT